MLAKEGDGKSKTAESHCHVFLQYAPIKVDMDAFPSYFVQQNIITVAIAQSDHMTDG